MKVSVIGLGYVGSVAAAGLATAGHDVLGIDIDMARVEAYQAGSVPIYEPDLSRHIIDAFDKGTLRFSHVGSVSEHLGDAVFVATGTPMAEDGSADLSAVESAILWVKEKQPDGGVIIMKSTVLPGTGQRLCETLLRDNSYKYVSNPEFLREGLAVYDWFHPDRIVLGGGDSEAISTVKQLYDGIDAPYVITDTTSSELIKHASNAFLATKISFINEIAVICDKLGGNIDDVSAGIGMDPRIGAKFLQAGVGYGGSCLPKDVMALDYMATQEGQEFELLRSVMSVNSRQRLLPVQALREALGRLSGAKIGVLGLSFKPNTDDIREAPAIDLVRALVEEGANVSAFDPQSVQAAAATLPDSVSMSESTLECVEGCQALVLMTEWEEIVEADWSQVAQLTEPPRFLFDGRNALDPVRMKEHGFMYQGVGRSRAT